MQENRDYLTEKEFSTYVQGQPNPLSRRYEWQVNLQKIVNYPPHRGPRVDYFNKNFACGTFKTGCGAKDWHVLPRTAPCSTHIHFLQCKQCGKRTEVVIVVEDE